MTIQEIKSAVDANMNVYWSNQSYRVIKDAVGQYLIICCLSDYCIGLTNRDGSVLNGDEEDFFIIK